MARVFPTLISHVTVTAVQGLRPGRRRTCRISRSSHVRNGWRARTTLKDRTISPSWPCTSCRLNAGGLHDYTFYEDSWSTRTPARSRQSAPTSKTPNLSFCFLPLCTTLQKAFHWQTILDAVYYIKGFHIKFEMLFILKQTPTFILLSFIIRLTDKAPKEYAVYRSPLLFWGLVDLVYDMFRVNALLFQNYCACWCHKHHSDIMQTNDTLLCVHYVFC